MNKKNREPMTRSENMSRIKGSDTKPEIYLRKLLWHRGIRYRINYTGFVGKPDIYVSKYKTAIFVNGCFWHMHESCNLSTIPKTNKEFWKKKLTGNAERDKAINKQLREQGIKVMTVWGCEIKKMRRDQDYREKMLDYIILSIVSGTL
ncbi:MAG: very short patch repair endonuclease [Eubacteriales bacterium]|nr:very short patch repair endonuclease [Eubacteriales bacterium]